MRKSPQPTIDWQGDRLGKTADQMERYFAQHPGSPSAVRRPQLSHRGGTFVVLLGRNLQNGIAGLGNTVEAALRAFDVQYVRAVRPPTKTTK